MNWFCNHLLFVRKTQKNYIDRGHVFVVFVIEIRAEIYKE